MVKRIAKTFEDLKNTNQKAFISFIMAGDPNLDKTYDLMVAFPKYGVDIIELGIPFTDPMADGPSIQRAGNRSLQMGTTLKNILELVKKFRKVNNETPVILMGYYNPIYSFGVENFLKKAKSSGVDGLIIVDLPPEEDRELCIPAKKNGIDFIRLSTPTSNESRLPRILDNSSGFVYHVSITGTTGAGRVNANKLDPEINRIRKLTNLPICVGFGIKNPEDAAAVSGMADGVVVGSAIIEKIETKEPDSSILEFIKSLSNGAKIGNSFYKKM